MIEHTNLYWGEIHTHTDLSDGVGSPEENFESAKRHLDFWSMTDHAYDKEVFSLDYRKTKPGGTLLNLQWDHIKELCRTHYVPGEFVPILGYEWTNFAQGQLRSFIERIERLEEEKKAIAADIKEVYAEAKGTGFDTKIMRKVVSLRKKDAAERQEEEAILDLYLSALGMAPADTNPEDE